MNENERPAFYRPRHRKSWLNEWSVAVVISSIAIVTLLLVAANTAAS